MTDRSKAHRIVPPVFWGCALVALIGWAFSPGYVVGWDLNVYKAAMLSLQRGHDPYADAIAIQRVFHAEGPHPQGTPVPFCYVYSPITLPLVALAAKLPLWLDGAVYWMVFFAATAFTVWFGMQFVEGERERRVFAYLAPAAVFFPGLLQNDVIFSGNVAYILYALVFGALWHGLRRGSWIAFYGVMIAVSCVKAPLLILVVIPMLVARKQVPATLVTIAVSVGLFAMQPHLWPELYRNYMTGVELQFSFNHDFSSSPAGLLADALYDSIPYKVVWGGFWVVTTCVFGGILLWLRQRYMEGRMSLRQWVPVMLCGVALLNPRIMEYDLAPITLPMALVLWRVTARAGRFGRRVAWMSAVFLILNVAAAVTWRPVACMTLVSVFFAGAWQLYVDMREAGQPLMAAGVEDGLTA
jgi:hypothetical protein